MRIAEFALERYFARWEFAVEHVLGASDVQGLSMAELLAFADDETRDLWDGLTLGYTESTGHPLLRREIAALYDGIEPDEVLTFSGAEEAIFCLMNALLGPGDHAIVPWPGYQSLYEVGRANGADITLHELHEADGWSLDVPRLLGALTPATRLVVVNAPHNPTGMLPSVAEWATLTRRAVRARHPPPRRRGLPLPRVRRGRSPDHRCRCVRAGRVARRHVEVVRAGRPADRLAGHARSRPAGTVHGREGLH